jgi:uncharacterized protein YndB with AHSA1/START domain
MTDRAVNHATFTHERTYPVAPAKVFAAWADRDTKKRWLGAGEDYELTFEVGGHETVRASHDGKQITWQTTYVELVPSERIVYTATLHFDDTLATASITTVELTSSGDSTTVVLTEHGAYLDGHELPEWREEGTATQLDNLTKEFS